MIRPFWTVKKYSCKKKTNKNTLIRVFSVIWVWTLPVPVSICEERVEGGGGGGYYNIFIHTWARTILGFKILNFNTFKGFQKNEYFLGYGDFVDIFWGHHKTPKKLTQKMVQAYVCMKISEYPPPPPPPHFSPRCEYAWNSWTISADVIFCVWGHYTDSKDTLGPRW